MDDCIQLPPITASHVVAVPYPGRGHVNPMMNLCKLLLSKNSDILVTFVVTEEWLGFIGSEPKPDNIGFATIPNVIPSEHGRASDFVGFFESVMTKMEAPFEELLHRLEPQPTVIIYDTYLFWVVRVANSRNIPVASFWPMSASVFAVFKHYHLLEQNGHYPVNVSEDGEKCVDYIPGNSSIRLADFPLNDENWRSRKLLELALNVIPWVQKAQYLLFPSIYELEPQAIDALKSELSIPIYTVGPVIPYFGNGHIDTVSNFADHELGYFQWLDNQPSGSVLYISQGSFLSVSNEQIDEIAAGVRESGVRFLWVQRGENDRLKEICGDKGLVLQWCDQLRVLQHHAIGGFWSHCGWNSTREGVFSGVPFLAFPIFMDQPLNGKLIVEEWKVGWRVRTKVKDDTLITKDEIASLIRKFMHLGSDEVRDMRKRSRELKQLCHGAITSVGDLHGDLKQARSALEMAGVLSSDGQDLWTGGETVLVQLGDILDRGEDEIAILSLLRSLDKQAKAKGGAVFQVNGNHETMNVEGDFRYVDSGGFDECNDFLEYINGSEDDWEETLTAWVNVSERWKEERTTSKSYWGPWNLLERQKGVIARSILFRPGGLLARELARHAVVLKVNDWVFCHGGLLPHHVAYGLERMNREVSEWMRGQHEDDNSHKMPFIATRGYDSVVWNRLYSRDTPDLVDYQAKQVCSILDETLQAVGAKAMVVGHTPQTIGVNCKYNCSIWRVDVGMSSGVLNSRPEVLEIIDDKARVIRCKRDRHSELQAAAYT